VLGVADRQFVGTAVDVVVAARGLRDRAASPLDAESRVLLETAARRASRALSD
jgi:hypothetical protein